MFTLSIIFLLAFMIEGLVEYLFGQAFDHIEALKPYRWMLMYIAAAVGVGGAFFYGFDLLYLLAGYLDVEGFQAASWPGMLLTGLAIGRGANYVHDLATRFFIKGKP